MPIMAAQPILQTQIQLLLSKGQSANQNDFASQFTNALSSVVPMGLFPAGLVPIPLAPTGRTACESMIRQALSLKNAANTETVSMMMATGISLLVPMVPPAGLMSLKSQIKSALSMKVAANPQIFATILSIAIPQYYMMGGAF